MGYFVFNEQTLTLFSSIATEPHLARLVVFNITSDRLSLSWRTSAKSFDNFVVEVRESAVPSRAMGRTLPTSARSTEISGLRGDTQYDIKLYGNVGGLNTPPLTAVATTGTSCPLSLPVTSVATFVWFISELDHLIKMYL